MTLQGILELSDRQRRLVDALTSIDTNGKGKTLTIKEASKLAGYPDPTQAWRDLKKPHIQAALIAAGREYLLRSVPEVLASLVQIATKGKSETARLQAAAMVLAKVGLLDSKEERGKDLVRYKVIGVENVPTQLQGTGTEVVGARAHEGDEDGDR